MDKEFVLGAEGKWIAPLLFREPHKPMPDNYKLALHRAKYLDTLLQKSETKKQYFLEFMQKIIDNKHAEIAQYLPPDKKDGISHSSGCITPGNLSKSVEFLTLQLST